MDTMHHDYHELAVMMYFDKIRFSIHMYSKITDEEKRRGYRKSVSKARARIHWHMGRIRAGAVVPADVAELAAEAERWLDAAQQAESMNEYGAAMKTFRMHLHNAGKALARHLQQRPAPAAAAAPTVLRGTLDEPALEVTSLAQDMA